VALLLVQPTIFRITRFGTSPRITGNTGTMTSVITGTNLIPRAGINNGIKTITGNPTRTGITATANHHNQIAGSPTNPATGNPDSRTAGRRIAAKTKIITATTRRIGIMIATVPVIGTSLNAPVTR